MWWVWAAPPYPPAPGDSGKRAYILRNGENQQKLLFPFSTPSPTFVPGDAQVLVESICKVTLGTRGGSRGKRTPYSWGPVTLPVH